LTSATFSFWQGKTTKTVAMRSFFEALHKRLAPQNIKVSADLLGLSFYDRGDLNIGQHLEDAAAYFDYLAPMAYPSHYAKGSFGFANPAEYPYEVVKLTLIRGQERLASLSAEILDYSATPLTVSFKIKAGSA